MGEEIHGEARRVLVRITSLRPCSVIPLSLWIFRCCLCCDRFALFHSWLAPLLFCVCFYITWFSLETRNSLFGNFIITGPYHLLVKTESSINRPQANNHPGERGS